MRFERPPELQDIVKDPLESSAASVPDPKVRLASFMTSTEILIGERPPCNPLGESAIRPLFRRGKSRTYIPERPIRVSLDDRILAGPSWQLSVNHPATRCIGYLLLKFVGHQLLGNQRGLESLLS